MVVDPTEATKQETFPGMLPTSRTAQALIDESHHDNFRAGRLDDEERIACPKAGGIGHVWCGWCVEHDRPRFECITDPHPNEVVYRVGRPPAHGRTIT